MKIAISGTPGVGKTVVSEILRSKGYNVISLNKFAEEKGFIEGYDEERDSKIIDIEALDDYLKKSHKNDNIIIEGHLSHLLSVDLIIILRCDPLVLRKRLKAKDWPEKKIKENVEAEILDVIKVEAHDIIDKVYEIDTTNKSTQEIALVIIGILNGEYKEPQIKWLEKYDYLLFD